MNLLIRISNEIKEIKDKLANVSTVINEDDLMIYALNGQPTVYNTFRTSMRTRSQSVTFSKLHVLLKSKESAIEKQSKCDDISIQPTAMLTNQNYGPQSNGNSS